MGSARWRWAACRCGPIRRHARADRRRGIANCCTAAAATAVRCRFACDIPSSRKPPLMNVLSNLAVRDVETLVHPYTNLATFRDTGPLVIERARGVYVYDTEGKDYIEGMAGLWCTALGYGNEELVEAAAAQMRKLSFAHLFTGRSHDPAIELAEKLKEIAPVPVSKVFFCGSGSEANDTQMKLVNRKSTRLNSSHANISYAVFCLKKKETRDA